MIKEFFVFKKYETIVGRTFSFLSPMTWTYLGLFFPPAGCYFVATGKVWLGVVFFLIGGLVDEIDGKVARYSGRTTYLGAFMDGAIDRFTDFFLILSFFFIEMPAGILDLQFTLFILLFVTLMPPFIVAYANHRKAVPDSTEKVIWRFSFRGEYYVIFILILAFSQIQPRIGFYLLWFAILLNGATVIQSMILAVIRSKNYPSGPEAQEDSRSSNENPKD